MSLLEFPVISRTDWSEIRNQMKRRSFLKLSSLALTGILTQSCSLTGAKYYDISIKSDIQLGHLIFASASFSDGNVFSTDYLVVGGGIAGLSAACQIRDRDFVLCELSEDLGGSSSSQSYAGEIFSQGAHYDLAYPNYYGQETLQFLEELGVIFYDSGVGLWDFVDSQYLIEAQNESKTLTEDGLKEQVLAPSNLKEDFLKLLSPYLSEMKMPTRLISEKLRFLNKTSFTEFLQRSLVLTPVFKKGIDYQMKDDYGANADKISALAGIHYYMCRPYYTKDVSLFSPPEGNYYFINKMANTLPKGNIRMSHLVRNISKTNKHFDVEVINIKHGTVDIYQTQKIIYAGQKHSLKYIFPPDGLLFNNNEYAPWLIINFVLHDKGKSDSFWQNEFLTEDLHFMGFIDSASQARRKGNYRIFTAYYCFDSTQRILLASITDTAQAIVAKTIEKICLYFNQDITSQVKKVFIKVMGHAMPIPKTNYLFNDKNLSRSEPNMVYAGVDNSRLPLLFEALDSGIQAIAELDLV